MYLKKEIKPVEWEFHVENNNKKKEREEYLILEISEKRNNIIKYEYSSLGVSKSFAHDYLYGYHLKWHFITSDYYSGYLKKIGAKLASKRISGTDFRDSVYKSGYEFYKENYYNEDNINSFINETIDSYREKYCKDHGTADENKRQTDIKKLEPYMKEIARAAINNHIEEFEDKFFIKSKEEEFKKLIEIAKKYDELSPLEKKAIQFANRKKAPTLTEGWIIFILALLVESIFYHPVACWVLTAMIFFVWRKNEIDKFN